jgi:hypothetical protein
VRFHRKNVQQSRLIGLRRYASGGSDDSGISSGRSPGGVEVGWALLTSHNMSSAAWGALQVDQSQLAIRSYELGILVTPQTEQRYLGLTFAPTLRHGSGGPADAHRTSWIPLPFALPPRLYSKEDQPWTLDKDQYLPDVLGWRWPRALGRVQPEQQPPTSGHDVTSESVHWLVRLGEVWKEYPSDVSGILEAAFRQRVTGMVAIGGEREVDMSAMKQQVIGQAWRSRLVRRLVD